jgi:DNA mismatch endonuclease (patch repair protein)
MDAEDGTIRSASASLALPFNKQMFAPGYTSWASTPAIPQVMQGNRKRDTAPELAVRRAAHALGLRYRVASRPIPIFRCTADLVFPRQHVAVFVDGCYWHGCPKHFIPPRTNADYWGPKLERNRSRDCLVNTALHCATPAGLFFVCGSTKTRVQQPRGSRRRSQVHECVPEHDQRELQMPELKR